VVVHAQRRDDVLISRGVGSEMVQGKCDGDMAELKPMTIEDMKAVISEMPKFSCDVDEKAWELWNDRFETH